MLQKNVYPSIESTTQMILDFNDKYDTEEYRKYLPMLEKDLSTLGEKLADRIEQEDRLVDILSRARDDA